MDNTQIPKRPTQYLEGTSRANYYAPAASPVQNVAPQQVYYGEQPYVQNGIAGVSDQKKGRRTISLKFTFKKLRMPAVVRRYVRWPRTLPMRIAAVLALLVLVASEAVLLLGSRMVQHTYAMGSAESLLPAKSLALEKYLNHDAGQAAFAFNPNFNPLIENKKADMGPRISATAFKDPAKGLSVVDPLNNVDLVMKPKFPLLPGEQNSNRVVYPLKDGSGWLVYTMQGRQVKEDVLLKFARGDRMSLKYEVPMNEAMEMRMQSDGSIGVFGTDLPLYGNVSTGTEKDKELLKKARAKAPKTKLLFTIPAPVVNESGKTKSNVDVKYVVNGNELKVEVAGLKDANYPLSIDPSVYVTSAQQFMRGNNESNIDFDTTNELIQKGKLTGARISGWNGTTGIGVGRWNSAVAVGGGFIYAVGGANGATTSNAVYWAQLDSSSGAVISPNPGSVSYNGTPPPVQGNTPVTCSGNWCTGSSYNLPAAAARTGLSTVVYNGYIYAIGGTDSSCAGTNNACSTVHYSKIGANGEPIGWTAVSSLGTARRFGGAVAYNNKIYVLGGQTNTDLNGTTSVEAADIRPDGTLSAWTTTGMTALPTNRWGATFLQSNGFIYMVGGSNGNTAQATVHYIGIKTDGTLDTWVASYSFTNARMTFGGSFATIYGNYLYVTSGCTVLSTTSCTTLTSTTNDFQLASINADGSITRFTTHGTSLSNAMTGYGLAAWRGSLYAVGGCTVVNGPTSCSGSTFASVYYGPVNSDGEVSTVSSVPALPTEGTGANQNGRIGSGVVINNGYIYSIGGCINVACTSMSDNTSRAQLNSDGTVNAWTTDSTRTGLGGASGLAAFGVAVYNNTIYAVGGSTGSGTYARDIYRVTLDSAGALTANWTATTNALPDTPEVGTIQGYAYPFVFARAQPGSATQGYLYMIGGCYDSGGIGCGGGYMTTVQRCIITNAGGAPSSCGTTDQLQLSSGQALFGGAVYGNYIYLAGGANSSNHYTSTVLYAKIDENGNIEQNGGAASGGWHTAAGTLPAARSRLMAFGVNGYLYAVGGHDSSYAPGGVVAFGKINPSTGDIASFSTSAISITGRWSLGAAYSGGYAYFIGGCTAGNAPNPTTNSCSTMSGVGEFVQVYNNWTGSPDTFVSSTNRFTEDRYGGAATVMNGYLYLAGGCTDSGSNDCVTTNGTQKTGDVSYAPLNPDGSLGTWVSAGTGAGTGSSMSQNRAFGRLENVGGTLYYMGGVTGGNGTPKQEVFYSTVGANGAPGAWTQTTNIFPVGRAVMSSAVYNGRIYVTGGITTANGNGTPVAGVYISPDLSSGGNITSPWVNNASFNFNIARSGHVSAAYGGKLYVMGGMDGSSNYLMDVQYAPIDSSGNIGTWVYGTSLPTVLRQGDGFATNGFIYIFGGRSSATTCTNKGYLAPINGDGSIGTWSQTITSFTYPRFGAAAAYLGGRAYILGGACGSSPVLSGNDRTIYSTVQLQPQTSRYSLMIDSDVDVFPSKYLVNGLDGGIGASWFMKYMSSTSAANSWGQVTNVGKLNLGTPGTYTPLDGAGVNTNNPPSGVGARYYMFLLDIDVQQAFGFPEDVSRGPNIYDITLLYSSSPGKRLIHGKTFTGGIQQPLDTPF